MNYIAKARRKALEGLLLELVDDFSTDGTVNVNKWHEDGSADISYETNYGHKREFRAKITFNESGITLLHIEPFFGFAQSVYVSLNASAIRAIIWQ